MHVETLVLKNTLEEKMLERSRRMTKAEHDSAKVLEDDGGIREIIQSARVMSLSAEDRAGGTGQMAPLMHGPEKLWARPGWNGTVKHRQQRRFEDTTDHGCVGKIVNDDDEDYGRDHKRQLSAERSSFVQ